MVPRDSTMVKKTQQWRHMTQGSSQMTQRWSQGTQWLPQTTPQWPRDRLEIWYVDNALDLVVKCKISHQCLYFCGSHVQKSAKKLVFTVFYRILTNFETTQTLGIWYVDNTHALVCPCIISRRCFYFCRSHVQRSKKNAFLQHFTAYCRTSRWPRDLRFRI